MSPIIQEGNGVKGARREQVSNPPQNVDTELNRDSGLEGVGNLLDEGAHAFQAGLTFVVDSLRNRESSGAASVDAGASKDQAQETKVPDLRHDLEAVVRPSEGERPGVVSTLESSVSFDPEPDSSPGHSKEDCIKRIDALLTGQISPESIPQELDDIHASLAAVDARHFGQIEQFMWTVMDRSFQLQMQNQNWTDSTDGEIDRMIKAADLMKEKYRDVPFNLGFMVRMEQFKAPLRRLQGERSAEIGSVAAELEIDQSDVIWQSVSTMVLISNRMALLGADLQQKADRNGDGRLTAKELDTLIIGGLRNNKDVLVTALQTEVNNPLARLLVPSMVDNCLSRVENGRKFQRPENRLQRATNHMIDALDHRRQVFNALLPNGLDHQELRALVREVDSDRDGFMSSEERLEWWHRQSPEVKRAFNNLAQSLHRLRDEIGINISL